MNVEHIRVTFIHVSGTNISTIEDMVPLNLTSEQCIARPSLRTFLPKLPADQIWLLSIRRTNKTLFPTQTLAEAGVQEFDTIFLSTWTRSQARPLRVFLCHSSKDKPVVRDLYHRLSADYFDPWLDEEKLIPGQDWDLEIKKAVRSSDAAIVCLSRSSVSKTGYIRKEVRMALDVADELPEGTIFLIPLKLENCKIQERLLRLHWVNYFEEDGYQRLKRALQTRAQALGLLTGTEIPANLGDGIFSGEQNLLLDALMRKLQSK